MIKELLGLRKWSKWESIGIVWKSNYIIVDLLRRTCEKTGDIQYKKVKVDYNHDNGTASVLNDWYNNKKLI